MTKKHADGQWVSQLEIDFRRVIEDSGLTNAAIAKLAGGVESQLSYYRRGQRDLLASAAFRIAESLGLRFVATPSTNNPPTGTTPTPTIDTATHIDTSMHTKRKRAAGVKVKGKRKAGDG